MFWPWILRILCSIVVLTPFVTASDAIQDVANVLYDVLDLTAPLWNATKLNDTAVAWTTSSTESSSSLFIDQLPTNTFFTATEPSGIMVNTLTSSESFLPSALTDASESGRGAETSSSPTLGLGAIVLSAFNSPPTTTTTQTTQSSYLTTSSLESQSSYDSTSMDILGFVSAIEHPTSTASGSYNRSFTIVPTTSHRSAVFQTMSQSTIDLRTSSIANSSTSSAPENSVIPISLGPSAAIYGTLTYPFQPSKPPITITTNGQTISIGPNGIGFAATTIAIPSPPSTSPINNTSTTRLSVPPPLITPTVINTTSFILTTTLYLTTTTTTPSGILSNQETIDGITISTGAALADISGTTYTIGGGAPTETVTVGGKTLSVGPSGVRLLNTTFGPTAVNGGGCVGKRDLRLVLASLMLGALGTLIIRA